METSTATNRVVSGLIVGETVPPSGPLPGLPVPVADTPQPAKPSKAAEAWERLKNSPHGRTIRALGARTGGFLAAATPPVVLAGVGYAIGSYHPFELSAGFGVTIGAIAGCVLNTTQFGVNDELVPTFKRLGHKYPYFASCLNATLTTGVPAAVAGMSASHYFNGGWGVTAAVVAGILGTVYGGMVQAERVKDARRREL